MSQKTRHVDPMLGYCWPSVEGGGPSLAQQWVNVSCLLGTKHDHLNVVLKLDLHQRRWTNIKTSLIQHVNVNRSRDIALHAQQKNNLNIQEH